LGRVYRCGAGWYSFHIDPYGEMSVCIMARQPSYSLRRGVFKTGFYEFFDQVLGKKLEDPHNKCDNCDKYTLCGNCPGWAQLEHGQEDQPVEYLCQLAELRTQKYRGGVTDEPTKKELSETSC
jgi:radical SAM protein with 4Fe4S-binding SPASM domain